jgi:hypothetical protein
MKTRIEQLTELVQNIGTEKMKELVILAKNYIDGLNKIFYDRDVSLKILQEIDFPMFIQELIDMGLLKKGSGMEFKVLFMDVFYIVRHSWEFTDKYGKLKTGDDLHNVWPEMFEGGTMMSVEDLCDDIKCI